MPVLQPHRVLKAFSVLLIAILAWGVARAEEPSYPSKPIVLMVPYAAGGGSDILARLIADGMSTQLGQPVLVDNRPGGSTGIAAGIVARSNPDGYTILQGNSSTFVVNELLNVKTPHAREDLTVIGMMANFPMVYVVANSSPIKSMADLVAAAKKDSGKLSYASPGVGSPHHLGMEALKYRAGIDLIHVPYRGVSPAFPDILTGRVDVMFADYAAAGTFIKDGKLRPLAVGSPERTSFMPNVPTMQSEGYANFELTGWQGLAVPTGTPPQIVNKLVSALRDTLADPETQKRLRATGLEPNFLDPAEFTQYLARERGVLKELIKANKVTK